MRRVWIVVVLAVLSSLVVAQGQRGVPDVRYARLAKGVNLPFWFWYGPGSQAGIEVRYSDEEFSTLAAVGVTFVRIPINLPFVHDENAGDHLNAANVAPAQDTGSARDRCRAGGDHRHPHDGRGSRQFLVVAGARSGVRGQVRRLLAGLRRQHGCDLQRGRHLLRDSQRADLLRFAGSVAADSSGPRRRDPDWRARSHDHRRRRALEQL